MLQPQGKLAEHVFWLPPQDGGKMGVFKRCQAVRKKLAEGPLQGSGHISSPSAEGALRIQSQGLWGYLTKACLSQIRWESREAVR